MALKISPCTARWYFYLVVLLTTAIPALACGGDPAPTAELAATPASSPAPVSMPQSQPTVAVETPTATAASEISGPGYDPTETMFQLFGGRDHAIEFSFEALAKASDFNDTSQVRVIVEVMRFLGRRFSEESVATLTSLTGQDFSVGGNSWRKWMIWLGEHPDLYRPPDGYLQWKTGLLSLIDPRFEEFLRSADVTSRIDLTELVWGGVRPDGIPDLQNAPVVSPSEADYLLPSDRVFGVSINGEHRAYPLRIVNPHEMAHDLLGGEPIALAY